MVGIVRWNSACQLRFQGASKTADIRAADMLCLVQSLEARMMKRLIAHFQNHVRQARTVLKWLARGRNA